MALLTLSWASGERYFSPSKLTMAISGTHGKAHNLFMFLILLFMVKKLHFGIKMCTIKFSIQVNIFQINEKDLTTTNNCEKCVQIF